jgi:diacylglycerol kinase family enzyme
MRTIADALGATPRAIDVGTLGDRMFFSIAGVGFDAHVARCFDRDLVGRRGFVGYARITARELLPYRSGDYRLEGDVNQAVHRGFLVTLANSAQFGNGVRVAPGARVDDGRLDLVVLEEASRFATMCALPRLFTGGAARMRGVSIRQVQRITIESDQPMTFHVDGEPVDGGTHLEGRVHPGALRVCVR